MKFLEKSIEMPKYRLISEGSAVESVESVGDEISDIIEFDVSEKTLSSKKKNYKVHVSTRTMTTIFLPAICAFDVRVRPELDTNIISGSSMATENQIGYQHSV